MPSPKANVQAMMDFSMTCSTDYVVLHGSYGEFIAEDSTIAVDIERIAGAGDIIWSERIDRLVKDGGSIIAGVSIVGVMQVADEGRVRHWREYFDSKPMIDAIECQAGDVG
jgi:limonene-1,2-epoxide hydrolase